MRSFLLMILFLPCFAHAQENGQEKIYGFINQVLPSLIINSSSDSVGYYVIDKADFSYLSEFKFATDSLYLIGNPIASPFSKTDSVNILQQIKAYSNFYFDKNKLLYVKVISRKKMRKKDKELTAKPYYSIPRSFISVPIFFDNGRKAVFYYGYYCGALCGGGYIYVYELVEGIWMKQYQILQWIS